METAQHFTYTPVTDEIGELLVNLKGVTFPPFASGVYSNVPFDLRDVDLNETSIIEGYAYPFTDNVTNTEYYGSLDVLLVEYKGERYVISIECENSGWFVLMPDGSIQYGIFDGEFVYTSPVNIKTWHSPE